EAKPEEKVPAPPPDTPEPTPVEEKPASAANPEPEVKAGETPDASPDSKEEEAEPSEEQDHHQLEGTEEGVMAIISDVDMLFDYFMGDAERGAARDNNNVDFIMNLVENLAGDQDLLNIRGRDSTSRSFTVINDIREKAAERAAGPRQKIQDAIEEARSTLEEGQEGRDIGGGLMVIGQSEESIEKAQEIETKIRDLQREENKISRQQRAEIQASINSYEWTNMLLTPTLVIIIGLLVGITRKFKTAAK
ncbi:MAG: hypothetical protein VCA40_05970, partial [Roseibacillus sp.]